MNADKFWTGQLSSRKVDQSDIDRILSWLKTKNNDKDLLTYLGSSEKSWKLVQAYIGSLVPGAVLDRNHYDNMCPACNFRHEETWTMDKVFGYSPRDVELAEYNQICSNCTAVLLGDYLCVCPLCNSGRKGTDQKSEPLYELTPRLLACFEDQLHWPPFPTDDASLDTNQWTKYNSPEFRYVMQCPICLYTWSIVCYVPDQISNLKDLCPVCGSPMREVGKGKMGGVQLECTNKDCKEGDVGILTTGGDK